MCAIFGRLGSAGLLAQDLEKSLAMLRHRGPDATAHWMSPDQRFWLGHTRLAILDLTRTGAQPMRDENNGNVMVFNGEIYNHRELRAELQSLGTSFLGTSDTETLLKGFGVWGYEVFHRLRGMFAFAIYHHASHTLFLCRDRWGIKPLYVGKVPDGTLMFSSEVRALLSFTGRSLSPVGLAGFLQRGCCPHQELIFKNIYEFPAGCWAEIPSQASSFQPVRFWPSRKVPAIPPLAEPGKEEDPAWEVRSLLENAVESHLLADVPVGCFLSGGIDSSVLTALACRNHDPQSVATFSVGFSEQEYDESQYAQQVAVMLKTNHHHFQISRNSLDLFAKDAVACMDLPTVDGLNTFAVSKQAAQAGLKVVLSGLGADEVFGGYPIFRDFSWIRLVSSTPRWLQYLGKLRRPGSHLFTDIPMEKTGAALAWWWRRLWSGDEIQSYFDLQVPRYQEEFGPPLIDAMAEITWGEIAFYLRDMLLRDSDAMSMAHSLELRVPFLDNHLVERVLSFPSAMKFDPLIPKSLLVRSTRDLLPEEIWRRPKMGFSLPMEKWMRQGLRDFCQTGVELFSHYAGISRRNQEVITRRWHQGCLRWPKLWSLVVLGHYLGDS